MPTIHVEARGSGDDLLDAARQLDPDEFGRFVARVLDLRAERQAPRLSAAEADLLLRINAGLPDELRQRWDELGQKRRAETLTPDEHADLLRLTEEVERRQADRLAALTELAQLRRVSLAAVMDQLGVQITRG
ncbi:MAG TPA: hypothetical protein VGF55_07040 [Gemmataceae bacterium]|jgi:hypothetical protein